MILSTNIFRPLLALFCVLSLFTQVSAQDGEKKVAVTTFFVDRHIGISDLSTNAAFAADIFIKMAKDSNFNLQPVLDDFKTKFFSEYVKFFPFAMKPEAEVLENKEYQAYEENLGLNIRPLTPSGYKVMYPNILRRKANRSQYEMLRIFPDVDGVMYVYLHYSFVNTFSIRGMGTAGIRANCSIWLYNKEGKKVFRIIESAISDGTVGMVAGVPVMDLEKILPLCYDASTKLFEYLNEKLPTIFYKAGKKL
jgi:hypothetical protein